MRRLVYYFLQGLIFLVPIVFTLWAVGSAFLAIDRGYADSSARRSSASGSR